MRFCLLFVSILLLSYIPFKGNYRIKIKEYNIVIVPDSCKQIIIVVDKKAEAYFKLYLKNCMGAMTFERFSLKDSTLLEKGNYISSLALLSSYETSYSVTKETSKIVVSKYYQPLKHGVWNFYDHKGNIIKKEKYDIGILQNNTK